MTHTAQRLYTIEQLPGIPDAYELDAGELSFTTPTHTPHGSVVMAATVAIGSYVNAHRLGAAFGEQTGFILERNPDTVRAPDVAFVREDRLPPDGLEPSYFEGGPDLAVEVISESNRPGRMRRKIAQYFAAGSRLVWVIDPNQRTVAVYASERESLLLHESDSLDGEDVLPGFQYPIAQLFSRIKRV